MHPCGKLFSVTFRFYLIPVIQCLPKTCAKREAKLEAEEKKIAEEKTWPEKQLVVVLNAA